MGGSGSLSPQGVLDVLSVDPLQTSGVSDLELLFLELGGLDDFDSFSRSLVVTSDFVVHLIDGAFHANVPVLLEHVVDSGVGAVLEEDAEVLGDGLALVVDLLDLEDLSVAALELVLALVELPETGSGDGFIGGDDLDNDNSGAGVLVGGEGSAVDQELSSAVAASVGDGSAVSFHK